MIDDARIKYLFDMIRMSPFIQGNPSYRKSAEQTVASFIEKPVVNAYAASEGLESHRISIYAGICNLSMVAAFGLACRDTEKFKDMIVSASKICVANSHEFTFADALFVINKHIDKITERMQLDAESFAYGCVVSILGHELGHICLHHTITDSPDGYTESISRNNERSADLFGASVVKTTPFASYLIPADLMVNVFLAWISNDEKKATSHPYARERAEYIYNSHDEILADYGITKEVFEAMMPPKKKK